jgi:hypothetical protein
MASLFCIGLLWLTTCGFVSLGDAANAGITEIVEPMTSEDFEAYEIMIEWGNLCMPNVKEYVTIRTEADKDSEAVGRLYKGGAAEVIEYGDEWTKVVSGDCEGYIATEYLEFGADAKEIAQRDCSNVATVTTQTLKVRAEASEDSKTKDLIGLGEKADVIGEENGWLKIKYEDGEAYIKAEYATVEFEVGEAQTMEQIRAAEEAAEAAKRKAELKKQYDAVRASGNEVQVLGALIQLEAGNQPYEGQLAVGAVVMNRVRSPRYPNTIADVIYAPGQFPAASKRVHEVMARGVKASCLQAAQEAINGVSNVGGFTHFKNSRSSVNVAHIVIGNHVFY